MYQDYSITVKCDSTPVCITPVPQREVISLVNFEDDSTFEELHELVNNEARDRGWSIEDDEHFCSGCTELRKKI